MLGLLGLLGGLGGGMNVSRVPGFEVQGYGSGV